MLCVSDFQPAQSSSAMPSSIETIGYFSAHVVQYAAISPLERADLSDFLKTYWPLVLSKNSLEAGSSAMLTCSPGWNPAAAMASRTIWMASSLDLQLGAKPPSSPTAVDRKSTRLNSSHGYISYAVFCLKKKKKHTSAALCILHT